MGEKNAEVMIMMVLYGDVTEPARLSADGQRAHLKGLSGLTDKSEAK